MPSIARIALTHFHRDVYEPSDDSFALVDALAAAAEHWAASPPRVCLEVGSGSGYVLCSLALLLRELGAAAALLATDINAQATRSTLATLSAHGLAGGADVVLTDLASALQPRLHGLVDLLVFNPPYVPTPDGEAAAGGIAAAWAGGARGRAVLDRLLPAAPALLSPRGEMFLVTVVENDPQEILRLMEARGLAGRVALRRGADQEQLSILHFWRAAAPAAPAGGPEGAAQQQQQEQPGEQAEQAHGVQAARERAAARQHPGSEGPALDPGGETAAGANTMP